MRPGDVHSGAGVQTAIAVNLLQGTRDSVGAPGFGRHLTNHVASVASQKSKVPIHLDGTDVHSVADVNQGHLISVALESRKDALNSFSPKSTDDFAFALLKVEVQPIVTKNFGGDLDRSGNVSSHVLGLFRV